MIPFDLKEARTMLARTPAVLDALLCSLPHRWLHANEGPGTWSPHEVVAHLLDGDRVDWLPRLKHLLEFGEERAFVPFDREGFRHLANTHTTAELLEAFAIERSRGVAQLMYTVSGEAVPDGTLPNGTQFKPDLPGRHPEFGRVTAEQLLATWVAHDHVHLVQINRTLARQYRDAVGPWREYLTPLQ